MVIDPNGAVVGVLLLPDRHDRLELIDRGTCGRERGIAVRRACGDDYLEVADGEVARPVVHDQAQGRVLRLEATGDLAHLRLSPLDIGLVLEVGHTLPATSVAHGAEDDDAPAE